MDVSSECSCATLGRYGEDGRRWQNRNEPRDFEKVQLPENLEQRSLFESPDWFFEAFFLVHRCLKQSPGPSFSYALKPFHFAVRSCMAFTSACTRSISSALTLPGSIRECEVTNSETVVVRLHDCPAAAAALALQCHNYASEISKAHLDQKENPWQTAVHQLKRTQASRPCCY